MDGCFCKEDVPWVVAMSQQIGNFPTVFRPIQIHNCLKMWPDEWFCFNFVTSMNDLSLVILWSLSVQYIYIHTRVYVRAQNVNISFNVDTCSSVPFAFWKLAVSFLSAAIFCLASVCSRSGLPRVLRCDCMFHGRITPISSISSSTYPQYTSIYINIHQYTTQCAIWCSLRSSLINTWIQQ